MKKAKTMNAYNLLYYTPKLWEKVVLWFCPLNTHETAECVIWYKKFYNRMYIYGYIRMQAVDAPNDGLGFNERMDTNYDNAGNN